MGVCESCGMPTSRADHFVCDECWVKVPPFMQKWLRDARKDWENYRAAVLLHLNRMKP